jgi:serpin B
MKKINIILSFLLLIFLYSCNSHKSPTISDDNGTIKNLTYTPYPPGTGNNYFGLDLYQEIKKGENGNIFFSPFSIFSALSMTSEGSKNITWNEMSAVLHLQQDNNTRWNAFLNLIQTINNPDKNYKLYTSNNLWLQKDFNFLNDYLNIVTNYYLAGLTTLDFVNDPEGARQTINSKVEEQTEGKIKELFPSGTINSYTRLVLTNAIYFKATWKYKFTGYTYEQDFYVSPENLVKVQMMHQKLTRPIEDFFGKAKVLELPYIDDEVSMFIFLPEIGKMAERKKINPVPVYIDLALPKFNIETKYNLNNILTNMGMPSAFLANIADFSGINGLKNLFITYVIHKAYVAVDEEGTEAAAATGVSIGATSVPPPATPFIVDRPFIFMICENSTGEILFMGRVINPQSN